MPELPTMSGRWDCGRCTLINSPRAAVCAACESPQPEVQCASASVAFRDPCSPLMLGNEEASLAEAAAARRAVWPGSPPECGAAAAAAVRAHLAGVRTAAAAHALLELADAVGPCGDAHLELDMPEPRGGEGAGSWSISLQVEYDGFGTWRQGMRGGTLSAAASAVAARLWDTAAQTNESGCGGGAAAAASCEAADLAGLLDGPGLPDVSGATCTISKVRHRRRAFCVQATQLPRPLRLGEHVRIRARSGIRDNGRGQVTAVGNEAVVVEWESGKQTRHRWGVDRPDDLRPDPPGGITSWTVKFVVAACPDRSLRLQDDCAVILGRALCRAPIHRLALRGHSFAATGTQALVTAVRQNPRISEVELPERVPPEMAHELVVMSAGRCGVIPIDLLLGREGPLARLRDADADDSRAAVRIAASALHAEAEWRLPVRELLKHADIPRRLFLETSRLRRTAQINRPATGALLLLAVADWAAPDEGARHLNALLDAGADPNERDSMNRPAVWLAACRACWVSTPAARAALARIATSEALSAKDAEGCSSHSGRTALHVACCAGPEMVMALLAAGADPLQRSNQGRVPLHDACTRESFDHAPEALRALAAGGALDAKTDHEMTPRDYAHVWGRESIVKTLDEIAQQG